MGNCAKCGKELDWSNNGFWNKQLASGYIEFNKWNWSISKPAVRKEFPEYTGKKICRSCALLLMNEGETCPQCGERWKGIHKCPKALTGEEYLALKYEKPFIEAKQQDKKVVVINDSVLSEDGIGKHLKIHTEAAEKYGYSLNHMNRSKGGDIVIYMDLVFEKKEMTPTKNVNVQINLDFLSLKEVMAQGGVVMTTYKCPNCNGMVDIPEAGKVLMCKYCGTPIKPVDIFEKIKSLIQSDSYNEPKPERQQPSSQVHNKNEPEALTTVKSKKSCRKCSKPIDSDESSRNEGICDDCWDNAKMKEDGLS